MSVALAEPTLGRPAADVRAGVLGPAPVRTRPRRSGSGVGPTARPRRLPPVAAPAGRTRACQAAPAAAPPRSWHLTERGLAVVLAVVAALVVASVVVVGLTALRVTGDGYDAGHSGVAPVTARR